MVRLSSKHLPLGIKKRLQTRETQIDPFQILLMIFSTLICRPIRTGYQFLSVFQRVIPSGGAIDDYENYDFEKM